MVLFVSSAFAQVTTSSLAGKVTLENSGEEVIGATVQAVHVPSGTKYAAVTNAKGAYSIQGMRAGGPYTVTVSYIGAQTKEFSDISLSLGETYSLPVWLSEDSKVLGAVIVVGKAGVNNTKTGAAQTFTSDMIQRMPSVSHSIQDVTRMNPLLATTNSGSMSFAGASNRYNSFLIDGAANNDGFGLGSTGFNGGQAGTEPISLETVEQLTVQIAPFDVRNGNFTGGSINAVTKSGTNKFHGSAYIDGNWQDLIGRHYKQADGSYSEPYQKQKEYRFGFTLGGPIVKDKLFFFANYEKTNKTYPNNYGIGAEGSTIDVDMANEILSNIKEMAAAEGLNYNSQYTNIDVYRKSEKASVKLDWNINDNNKLSLRWGIVDAAQLSGVGGQTSLNTSDHQFDFKSTTNSITAELQSRISDSWSNEARLTYVGVRDRRTSGSPFPSITIYKVNPTGETGTVNIGNEYSSMANGLDQDTWTFEDNLNWLVGNHNITFGTHNEYYQCANLYIPNLYGSYYFSTFDDFKSYYNGWKAGAPQGSYINQYYLQYANKDITGDSRWIAEMSSAQFGLYAQDRWDVADNFQLTYGLRVDLPVYFTTPMANTGFNEWATSKGYDIRTDRKLPSKLLWSPRVGFRWDVLKDNSLIVRGGAGIFSGRVPYVWLENNIANTGNQFFSYNSSGGRGTDLRLILNPDGQEANGATLKASGSQVINAFDVDLKLPQTLKANLAVDANVLGIDWTLEGLYTKNLNDVYYQNLAYETSGQTVSEKFTTLPWNDTRAFMTKATTGTAFNNIYYLTNTSKGYAYNVSVKGEKKFNFGLDLSASYTYSVSKSICPATSSVAQSNWRGQQTAVNPNEPELSNSPYNTPHMIKASAFYHVSYGAGKAWTTTFGIIYTGQSGNPYHYQYYGDYNGDGYNGNDLMYIPTDAEIDKMSFVATSAKTAEQQAADLKAWIHGDKYMSEHQGSSYERYGSNLPFESHFDFHFSQDYKFKNGHKLQITFDVLNVANMLNRDWGSTWVSSSYVSSYASPLTYKGNGTFQFTGYDANTEYMGFNKTDYYSRWRGQLALKYTF